MLAIVARRLEMTGSHLMNRLQVPRIFDGRPKFSLGIDARAAICRSHAYVCCVFVANCAITMNCGIGRPWFLNRFRLRSPPQTHQARSINALMVRGPMRWFRRLCLFGRHMPGKSWPTEDVWQSFRDMHRSRSWSPGLNAFGNSASARALPRTLPSSPAGWGL